jgi:(1->4)-alpha-D-glucan 1-alpha-D-glucosylmutase
VEKLAPAGICNSLVQCALKLTLPGVTDLYQGAELWDFSLVDPDNRRPVDYEARKLLLDSEPDLATWRTGAVKLALIQQLLALRRERPKAFEAELKPVAAPANVLAFRRGPLLIAVPLLCARSCMERGIPLPTVSGTIEGRDCAELFAELPVAILVS